MQHGNEQRKKEGIYKKRNYVNDLKFEEIPDRIPLYWKYKSAIQVERHNGGKQVGQIQTPNICNAGADAELD